MNKKGLTLVETLVASAIITTLMLGSIPPTVKMLQQKVAQKTAREIIAIQEAEKNYWIDKLNSNGTGEWAPDITTLKNKGYLPSSWSATNLFGYSYSVSTSSGLCSVSTRIPKGLEGVVQTLCPNVNVSYSGNYAIVSSSIPIPGQEPTMQNVLHRSGSQELRIAEENIGTKKGLIVGDAQMMDATKEGDIYVKALKEKGVSRSGWLSEAEFPAEIKTFMVQMKYYKEIDFYPGVQVHFIFPQPSDYVEVVWCNNGGYTLTSQDKIYFWIQPSGHPYEGEIMLKIHCAGNVEGLWIKGKIIYHPMPGNTWTPERYWFNFYPDTSLAPIRILSFAPLYSERKGGEDISENMGQYSFELFPDDENVPFKYLLTCLVEK